MKHLFFVLLALLSGLFEMVWAAPVKVACIGNSITYGAFIPNREENCYPAQLQAYLGSDYEVRNFGVSGSTLLSKGDYPYVSTNEYKASKDFQPDIVLIKLGTNDTKPQNWRYKEEFMSDYRKLIHYFQSFESHPRIILLTPVRCFLLEKNTISPELIEGEVRPMIETLAWENKLEIINLFNLFGDVWESHIMPDRLHPSSIGAGEMAVKIGEYLTQPTVSDKEETMEELQTAQPFNFHGFQGYDFDLDGVPCKIVKPYVEAPGRPWMIRARFWGHEPQTDIALLEHGYHIVYCDVADLYGSQQAVERWNNLYRRLVKAGFGKKVALEGMSRGGLIIYNWAAANPNRVACIYADAPVMDFKSWPMGKGHGSGSADDTRKLLSAYGFSNESEALAWQGNPLDHARIIAKAGIPVLHVVGDADEVVPVDENTAIFEKEMARLGAPITVIHKPGVGHHPHSLNDPEPIVRFILSAMGRLPEVCTHAVPGNEYRSAAGWSEGSEWHGVAEDIRRTLSGKTLKLLLLGNSITQGWGGTRQAVTYKPGKQALDKLLGEGNWESAGISGDRTQHLLWRIRHDGYGACHPEQVVIAIGVNNLLAGQDAPEEVAKGIIAVSDAACQEFPDSRIILLGLFPAGQEPNSELRKKCDRIHDLLAHHKFKGVEYINPTPWLTDASGNLGAGLYGGDGVHLTGQGYEVLAEQLVQIMNKNQ